MKLKVLLLLSLTLSDPGLAENWPQWRGPHFNGATTEKGLPTKWSKTEGVDWTFDLAGPSASTPVIWGDRVFLSGADKDAKTLHAICLDRVTGKLLWNHKVADGFQRDDRSNYSSPSPVADSERVFFFYGNGDLVAFAHDGRSLWTRKINKDYGDFAFQWTFSSSPVLWEGHLFLQVLQRNMPVHGRGKTNGPIESYLLALDPANGKTVWRHVRPADAVIESLESFSTPMPFEHNGRKELLVTGGDCVSGHDPATGRELWRWGTWNPGKIGHWRLVPSPVGGGGVVMACAPKGAPVYAVKAGGTGVLPDSAIAWKTDENRDVTSDVPSPLFMQGDFFVLSDVKRNIARVAPDGAVKWKTELPGRKKYEASPLGADEKVYVMNFAGDVVVVDSKDGKILNTIPMGEPEDGSTRSSISAAHGRLYIRTNTKLYCVKGI